MIEFIAGTNEMNETVLLDKWIVYRAILSACFSISEDSGKNAQTVFFFHRRRLRLRRIRINGRLMV